INGNLNDFGRQFLRRLALNDLCRRLKVIAYLTKYPEISKVEIPPIILIMAAPRTGTTLLHNLMATHPLARTFLRWELMDPVPSPAPETYTTDPRITKLQASIEPLRGSLLEQMHWVNADEPEENTWGFIDCTGLLGRSIEAIMPTWSGWVWEYDHKATFRDFRKLVQLLLWKCPPPSGGHLLLKCVLTTAKIQMFADEFPEANFVLVHRDPFRITISAATIAEGIYQPFIRQQPGPLHEDGLHDKIILKRLKVIFRALVKFMKAEPQRVANVQYLDLMSDAVAATRSAFNYFAMDLSENFEQGIRAFLEQQRSGKRVAPPKKYDNFGYDAEAVWANPSVADYCKFFGVKQERTRLIDTKTGL
ncbi:MAG: sulfotransferase, partial [Desulfobacteraceae bacterium]